jgi:predicted Na+-dependent transporter
MKFVIRRAFFALITTPVILLAYAVIYFGLGLVADSGSVGEFASVAPSVAIGYFVALLVLPSLYRLVDKVVA